MCLSSRTPVRVLLRAGKTYTMQGNTADPTLFGMIPRALQLVWDTMRSQSRPFRISVSMIEVGSGWQTPAAMMELSGE